MTQMTREMIRTGMIKVTIEQIPMTSQWRVCCNGRSLCTMWSEQGAISKQKAFQSKLNELAGVDQQAA